MNALYTFPDITLLVTHYNRAGSLERLLESFHKLGCTFGDIVVSDDGSKPENLDKVKVIQEQYKFRLITTPKNRGLGNNINKGQDAVTTPYTLYVQEDFVPNPIFPEKLKNAIDFIHDDNTLDVVRFYAYFEHPYLKPLTHGFSEMKFKLWYPGYKKFYIYSDHPHLRRSSFLEKFGRYTEGTKGDVTEYRMMMSFLQNKGKALFYEDFKGLFDQKNSSDEPSTMKRNQLRESDNFFITNLRHAYRHAKFNYDYLFRKMR